MSGMGGGGPWPSYMSGPMGYAAEARQLAGRGMMDGQLMARNLAGEDEERDSQLMANQMAAMQPGGHIRLTNSTRISDLPDIINKMIPDRPLGKPTKRVCAYCGGPDYKERSCPGCGATEKEARCKS